MPRYIDADALCEEIRSLQVTVTGLRLGKGVLNKYARFYRNSVMRVIDEQPTADVEKVVRCKDCRHYQPNQYGDGDEMVCKHWADWTFPEPYDFCSYGERKDQK